MNEMQPLVFEKGRFVFQELLDNRLFFALSIHIVCDARKFSRATMIERCSGDGKLLIETMIEEIEKVLSRGIDSVF